MPAVWAAGQPRDPVNAAADVLRAEMERIAPDPAHPVGARILAGVRASFVTPPVLRRRRDEGGRRVFHGRPHGAGVAPWSVPGCGEARQAGMHGLYKRFFLYHSGISGV